MDLIADIFLIGGAAGAAFYCLILSRRLSRFTNLDRGVGGAVAVLSARVDVLTRTLEAAKRAADGSDDSLRDLTGQAEQVARRLELSLAALHDVDAATPEPVCVRSEPKKPAASVFPAAPLAATRNGPTAATQFSFSHVAAAR